MSYVYCIGDDKISDKFSSIKKTLYGAVENIYEDDIFVYGDKYILVDVMEAEDYSDGFKSKFIALLENISETAYYDGIEDYLDSIDIYDCADEMTDKWDRYRRSKGVSDYYTVKDGTLITYKVYVKQDGDSYCLVDYEVYKDDGGLICDKCGEKVKITGHIHSQVFLDSDVSIDIDKNGELGDIHIKNSDYMMNFLSNVTKKCGCGVTEYDDYKIKVDK